MINVFYTGLCLPRVDIPSQMRLNHTPTIRVSFDCGGKSEDAVEFIKLRPIPVFMSRNAVKGFNRWLKTKDIVSFTSPHCWCVGKSTADELTATFDWTVKIPQVSTSSGMMAALNEQDVPILLVAAKQTRGELIRWMRERRQPAMHLPVYETFAIRNDLLRCTFQNLPDDLVVFTSPSTVSGFLETLDLHDLTTIVSRLVSIGPTTSAAIRSSNGEVYQEAEKQDTLSLFNNIFGEMTVE